MITRKAAAGAALRRRPDTPRATSIVLQLLRRSGACRSAGRSPAPRGTSRPWRGSRASACSTTSCAISLPAVSASSIIARSAKITPPVRSMFARMRSGKTSRPLDGRVIAASAAPVDLHDGRDRRPLGMPAADRALVLLHHAAREMSRRAPGMRVAAASATAQPAGLRLCGIDDEPPPGSVTSPTLVLHQQRDVARHLAERGAVDAASPRRARPGDRDAVCHGAAGRAEPKALRERVRDGRPTIARAPPACPTAPPNCEHERRVERGVEPLPSARERRHPSRGFQSKRDRRRRLQQRPARASPCARDDRIARAGARSRRVDDRPRGARAPACSTSTSAVSATSWLVTPQCTNVALSESSALTRAVSAFTNGTTTVPDARASRAIASASNASAVAAARIDVRRALRDDAETRLHARERRLEVEHRLQQRSVREDRRQRVGRRQAVHQAEGHVLEIEKHGFVIPLEADVERPILAAAMARRSSWRGGPRAPARGPRRDRDRDRPRSRRAYRAAEAVRARTRRH